MKSFTSIALLAGTAAAAALPQAAPINTNNFNITNFVFGCTVGCDWYFDLSIEGSEANHPALAPNTYKCQGNLDDDKDYKECAHVSETQALYAYIVKETNELKLQYEVQNYNTGAIYRYYGNTTVYAATGDNAALQKPDFKVPETSATGVL